ncbi:tyrosine-type recombinase/integrase [Streptomyces collinus]|uniref:tyrosine-type recombinase/integrase n=1 Tax=Streptomyces collinus TaxID=42684 RepID=UPI0033CF1E38
MSPRKPNMESTIYFGADGWWHGRVTMGVKSDGSPDRRHRRARTEPEIKRKVKEPERLPGPGGGGLVFTRPKTKKSRNTVPIPPVFVPFLHDHKARQEAMRAAAGELWQEHEVVFSRPDGRPLDPRADYEEFRDLLKEAGIDDRRLYDGSRHTAGTILNELGVDMPTIMEILRHTQISQTRRYLKGRSQLSKDAMRRMGEFFVPRPAPPIPGPTETKTETTDTRAARSQRRRRIR